MSEIHTLLTILFNRLLLCLSSDLKRTETLYDKYQGDLKEIFASLHEIPPPQSLEPPPRNAHEFARKYFERHYEVK